jgi:hypothetical protein
MRMLDVNLSPDIKNCPGDPAQVRAHLRMGTQPRSTSPHNCYLILFKKHSIGKPGVIPANNIAKIGNSSNKRMLGPNVKFA